MSIVRGRGSQLPCATLPRAARFFICAWFWRERSKNEFLELAIFGRHANHLHCPDWLGGCRLRSGCGRFQVHGVASASSGAHRGRRGTGLPVRHRRILFHAARTTAGLCTWNSLLGNHYAFHEEVDRMEIMLNGKSFYTIRLA